MRPRWITIVVNIVIFLWLLMALWLLIIGHNHSLHLSNAEGLCHKKTITGKKQFLEKSRSESAMYKTCGQYFGIAWSFFAANPDSSSQQVQQQNFNQNILALLRVFFCQLLHFRISFNFQHQISEKTCFSVMFFFFNFWQFHFGTEVSGPYFVYSIHLKNEVSRDILPAIFLWKNIEESAS